MSDNVDFVITNEDWDKNFDEVSRENMSVKKTLMGAIQMDLLRSTYLCLLSVHCTIQSGSTLCITYESWTNF